MADFTLEDAVSLLGGEFGQSEQGGALIELLNSQEGFRDKQLDQAWRIAELNESGANTRAGISAGASTRSAQIGASASMKNAALAAKTQRYGIDMDRLTATERIALEREMGYGDLGIRSGQLGLGYLDTASQLRGPENYLESVDFMRGASQRQDVPVFLQSLMNGGVLPGFQAPGGSPQGLNMQGLMQQMGFGGAPGGGGSPPNTQNNAFLAAVRAQNAKGLHTLAPGSLERLNPDELALYKNASEYSGDGGKAFSWNDLLSGYKRAQVGQGNPLAA